MKFTDFDFYTQRIRVLIYDKVKVSSCHMFFEERSIIESHMSNVKVVVCTG